MKKGKIKVRNLFAPALILVLTVLWGFFVGLYGMGRLWDNAPGKWGFVSAYCLTILLLALGFYIQIILHEGGHLLFGLLTGYRFSSFRIGKTMLMKNSSGWHLKKLFLAGTGGQCLLAPPEYKDGDFPVTLYNLGGVLFNLIVSAVFLLLFLLRQEDSWRSALCFDICSAGVLVALTNGIPLNTPTIVNDGYNVMMLRKSIDARRAMWVQLEMSRMQTEGLRLKEMPEEWFRLPEEADMHNVLISSVGVFAENRAMDAGDRAGAAAQIEYLLGPDCTVPGIYEHLLRLDRLSLEILEKGSGADISLLKDRKTAAFLKSMKNFPSVIRTQYLAARWVERDEKKQSALLKRFEACAARYPSPGDIASERELMEALPEAGR